MAISTTLIVTAVMGVVTVLQHRHELRMGKNAREALLKESLSPLVYRLGSVESREELREEFIAFCHAFVQSGYHEHQMELRDSTGRVVVSTLSESGPEVGKFFWISVPVTSPVLGGQHGTITLLEDASEYNETVSRQWRSWALHMAATLLPILLFVSLATRYVVTRPLERLLDRIRKMEMGYWEQATFDEGPWEIRWLGWRFRNLGIELKTTVEELIKAERRAARSHQPSETSPWCQPSDDLINSVERLTGNGDGTDCGNLRQKYQALIAMDPNEPETLDFAREIWEKDAKEAGRVGEMKLKAALEDESLRILEPRVFPELQDRVSKLKVSLADWARQCEEDLKRLLDEERIPYVNISHRVKHVAGIWRKMRAKDLSVDEIDDIYAFRIIVATESDCYWTLGKIHEALQPLVGRFNDYIASPKPNGYQSLHTCVRAATGPVFEIQIRSVTMHQHAERGSAAHWLYKERQHASVPDRSRLVDLLRKLLGRWKGRPSPNAS